jgi:hypothetical protein
VDDPCPSPYGGDTEGCREVDLQRLDKLGEVLLRCEDTLALQRTDCKTINPFMKKGEKQAVLGKRKQKNLARVKSRKKARLLHNLVR